jgi:predicted GNAT family acetyltransferase
VDTRRFTDAREFFAAAKPLLAVSEARHNLIYGVGGTLVSDPAVYPDFRLWLVEADGRPVAAAIRTLPYNVIVADARDDAAVDALVAAVAAEDPDAPGAVGNVPTIERFTETWARVAATEARRTMAQGVFALERVRRVPVAPGGSRPVTAADRDLLFAWFEAFTAEALPDEPSDSERLLAFLDRRIAGGPRSGIWLWEHEGEPVAMSGYGGPTPHGIRIGPVYTPPEQRGRGYATALVAAQSAWLLTTGRRFCFLYTDLANPTSNAIYERIGYERVADAAMYIFGRSPG